MKRIYFCTDLTSYEHRKMDMLFNAAPEDENILKAKFEVTYEATSRALRNENDLIVTTSIAHLSFDLMKDGYEIFLCYEDKVVKLEPHMDLSANGEHSDYKDIRPENNILKMFMAGVFNEVLGIKD